MSYIRGPGTLRPLSELWSGHGLDRSGPLLPSFPDELHLELDAPNRTSHLAGNLGIGEPLQFPAHDPSQVFREALEQAIELPDDHDPLFGAGLGAVDVVEHPAGEERWLRPTVVLWGRPVARHGAASRETSVGDIDDLAHRDPYQEPPEFLPAGRRGLPLELLLAESRKCTLKDVLLILMATD